MSTLSSSIANYPLHHAVNSPVRGEEEYSEYTKTEKKLLEQYGTDIVQLRKTFAEAEPLPGVEYDEHGIPVCYTVPECFDALDKKLIAHFGEEYRLLTNKRRKKWNKEGIWKFDLL
jgi:hypothetical protein